MQFSIGNEILLPRLQQAVSVVERRNTIQVLSNLLFSFRDGTLYITGSDTEVQVVAQLDTDFDTDFDFTVPARKLIDLLKAMPETSIVHFNVDDEKVSLKSGTSKYSLTTLPASSFPLFEHNEEEISFQIPSSIILHGLKKSSPFMAQQDVRYFLNGVMIELAGETFRCVASDGHRMAVTEVTLSHVPSALIRQFILPRKAVLELLRLLPDTEVLVTIKLAVNTCGFIMPGLSFSSKLIEGRYPDFKRVLPTDISHVIHLSRQELKSVLTRIAILTSEKSRAVMLHMQAQSIHFEAHCADNDSANETLSAEIVGEPLDLCFNVQYLLDVIASISSDSIRFSLGEQTHTALFEDIDDNRARYLVMPLRV